MSKRWRNASTKDCVGIIICAVISVLVLFVPFSFDGELTFTFATLPLIGDSSIANIGGENIYNLTSMFLNVEAEVIANVYGYLVLAYFGILILDIIFAVLLMTTKLKTFRIIFKIFSVLFAIVFLAFAIVNIAYIVGLIFGIFNNLDLDNFSEAIQTEILGKGIVTALAFIIFSFILVKKQLRWFSKPAWAKVDVEEEIKYLDAKLY